MCCGVCGVCVYVCVVCVCVVSVCVVSVCVVLWCVCCGVHVCVSAYFASVKHCVLLFYGNYSQYRVLH